MTSLTHDFTAKLKPKLGYMAELTAGGSEDGVAQAGTEIDRLDFDSATVVVSYLSTLADTKTLINALAVYDCATSGGTYTHFATISSLVTLATGLTTSDTAEYTFSNIDLAGAERYIKIYPTNTFSATGTDTAIVNYIVNLGGAHSEPTSPNA